MDRSIMGLVVGICLAAIISFKTKDYTPAHSSAEVAKIEGFYIFTDSRPVLPFDSLGLVDLGFVTGTQYESIRANLIKRARKQYPLADGLILHFDKKGVDNCTVLKFR